MAISTLVLHELARENNELAAIATAVGCSRRDVCQAMEVLKKRRLVDNCATGKGVSIGLKRGTYAISDSGLEWVTSGKVISPGQGTRRLWTKTRGLSERAWWYFRTFRVATLLDILNSQASGKEKTAYKHLHLYVTALEVAGILMRTIYRVPVPGRLGLVQWQLVQDLGPKTPVWRQIANEIFDPNGRKVFSLTRRNRCSL